MAPTLCNNPPYLLWMLQQCNNMTLHNPIKWERGALAYATFPSCQMEPNLFHLPPHCCCLGLDSHSIRIIHPFVGSLQTTARAVPTCQISTQPHSPTGESATLAHGARFGMPLYSNGLGLSPECICFKTHITLNADTLPFHD